MEWRRGHVIGCGSSATVSTATSSHSGHVFAVKSAELSQSGFLQNEQKILSILKSPHIVRYIGHDVSKENNKLIYNLFMEYVPGGTLSDTIRKNGGRLNESTIAYYTRDILSGLDYLHSIGITHCDIKGENILIGKDGAKVADFGCAKWHCQAGGTVGGTPMFMAPEAARGEHQGFPTDVWALGCTVIEMATGEAPWPDQADHVSALYKIGYSEESPEIPEFLSIKGRDFLSKCLRRDSGERWTVKQLLDHPFLEESDCFIKKQCLDNDFNSPTSILDQGVWNSIKEPETLCGEIRIDGGDQLLKGIRRLVSSFPAGIDWTREENWIRVR